jgi:hypothetical protein
VSLKKVSVGSFTGGTNPSFLSGSTDLISNASGIVSLENASVYLHYGPSPGTKYFPIIYQLDSSGNYCTPTDTVAIQIQPATLSSVAISTTFVSSFISQFPSALIEGDSILYIEKYCTGITGNPEFISNDNYSEFNITPNPSSGLFTINIKGTKQPYTINVFDVMGKKIWTGKGNSTQQVINLSEAGKGIYFVKLHGEQLNKTQKVVVQ